jgi:ATP-dependent DNA ligase
MPMARVSCASLRSLPMRDPAFIEPMECLAVAKLSDAPGWVLEIKLDGYRAIAVKDAEARGRRSD